MLYGFVAALVVAGCVGAPAHRASSRPIPPSTPDPALTSAPVLPTIGTGTEEPAEPGPVAATAIPELGRAPIGETERATVVRVVDGDTIVIDRGQGAERLRYIGVDTPESVKPDSPVEFMAREASAANERLVAGKDVLLERDLTEYDRFDRLLRYVWVEDAAQPSGWLLVNLALVQGGYAQVVTYPPDVRYVDLYLDAQRAAREKGLGLWAGATPAPATPLLLTGGSAAGRNGCDAAYPGVCIPPAPPDLDCGEITFRRFTVLAPDPHRFDLDFDGVGCEGG